MNHFCHTFRSPRFNWLPLLLLLLNGSCSEPRGKKMGIDVMSSAFQGGSAIPKKYTADGENISPPLEWSTGPPATRSFALIVDDPDAPSKVWVHWVLFNLPADVHQLDEHVKPDKTLENGARQGTNDFPKIGYGGPAPPPGKPHRYVFTVYALDAKLELPAGATKEELLKAMNGHVLDEGQFVGTYAR